MSSESGKSQGLPPEVAKRLQEAQKAHLLIDPHGEAMRELLAEFLAKMADDEDALNSFHLISPGDTDRIFVFDFFSKWVKRENPGQDGD
jgi:hypothetical protein